MAANQFTFPVPKFCHTNVINTPPPPLCNAVLTPPAFRFAFPAKKRQGALYITYPRHQPTQILKPTPLFIIKTATSRIHTLTISHYCNIFCNILQSFKKLPQKLACFDWLAYFCRKKMERRDYQTLSAQGQKGRIEQLLQLLRITFDGDLINKTERDALQQMGYCTKSSGFNIITPEGIKLLNDLGLIHP